MRVQDKQITFVCLDSGNKELDAIWYIKQLFEIHEITPSAQMKILDYLRADANGNLIEQNKNHNP